MNGEFSASHVIESLRLLAALSVDRSTRAALSTLERSMAADTYARRTSTLLSDRLTG